MYIQPSDIEMPFARNQDIVMLVKFNEFTSAGPVFMASRN